jgi:ferredoxin
VSAIHADEHLPQHQMPFLDINARLAAAWPTITRRKPAPPDADDWAKVEDKRHLLDESHPRPSENT